MANFENEHYDFRAVSSLKLYGDHSVVSYFFCTLSKTFLILHLKELMRILNKSSDFATIFVAMFHNLEPLYMKSLDGEGKTIRVPLFLCESFIFKFPTSSVCSRLRTHATCREYFKSRSNLWANVVINKYQITVDFNLCLVSSSIKLLILLRTISAFFITASI